MVLYLNVHDLVFITLSLSSLSLSSISLIYLSYLSLSLAYLSLISLSHLYLNLSLIYLSLALISLISSHHTLSHLSLSLSLISLSRSLMAGLLTELRKRKYIICVYLIFSIHSVIFWWNSSQVWIMRFTFRLSRPSKAWYHVLSILQKL